MSCKTNKIIDSASLYKNGLLIDSINVSFDVVICNSVDIKIISNIICCKKTKIKRINFVVENIGDNDIRNGFLKVYITSNNLRLSREFEIFKIESKCKNNVYIDVPFNCCFNYQVSAKVEVDGEIIKEKNSLI